MDIAAAKKRCEAATLGPWVAEGGSILTSAKVPLALTMSYANARFAAHARSDLPAALEALEEVQLRQEWVEGHLGETRRERDGYKAREAALVGALKAEKESFGHDGGCDECTRLREENTDWAAWPSCDEGLRLSHRAYELRRDALADTSPAAVALLAQGERLTTDIETLREMAHDFYEGGRPITKEQLDAFCAVGPSDTSPAALLAQGERLRSFRDELRGTPGNSVGPFQWIADRLDSILEEDTRLGMSRAALAPGEEKE